jgi:hypothetical protein
MARISLTLVVWASIFMAAGWASKLDVSWPGSYVRTKPASSRMLEDGWAYNDVKLYERR